MKKTLTTLAACALFGAMTANAITVNFSIRSSEVEGVEPWECVKVTNLTPDYGTFPEITENEFAFTYSGGAAVLQIEANSSAYYIPMVQVVGSTAQPMFTTTNNNYVWTLTLDDSTNNNGATVEVPVYNRVEQEVKTATVEASVSLPSAAQDLVSSVSWLGTQLLSNPTADDLKDIKLEFENTERVNEGYLGLRFLTRQETNEAGETVSVPVYNVGQVVGTYTTEENPTPQSLNVVATSSGCELVVRASYKTVSLSFKLEEELTDGVTINLDTPGAAEVNWLTQSSNGTDYIIPLEQTTNVLDQLGSGDVFIIQPTSGYAISKVLINGVESTMYDTRIEYQSGMVIDVTTETAAAPQMAKFYVYFPEDKAAFTTAEYSFSGSSWTSFANLTGENAIEYNASNTVAYIRLVAADSSDYIYSFSNGVYNGQSQAGQQNLTLSRLADGYTVKVYTEQQEIHSVAIEGVNGADNSNILVSTDNGYSFTSWYNASTAPQLLAGTELTLRVPANFDVEVNGELIQPVETSYPQTRAAEDEAINVYVIEVTENLSLYINGNEDANFTGIGTIGNEAGERVIYNLQGVRVNGDNLPAGIYIINGRKHMVR